MPLLRVLRLSSTPTKAIAVQWVGVAVGSFYPLTLRGKKKKKLQSARLILSEPFRINTLYFISIHEKRCHTAVASPNLSRLMFYSTLLIPEEEIDLKGKKTASDNKIRDIKN